jgi:hypothetical protein
MNKTGKRSIILAASILGISTMAYAFTSVCRSTITASVTFTQSVPADAVTLEANYLLKCQIQDTAYGEEDRGCFNDVIPGSGPSWVVPRENGTAILGLIEAYQDRGLEAYKTSVLRAAAYLRQRQEEDGSWCENYNEVSDTRTGLNKSPSHAGSVVMAWYKMHMTGWDASNEYYAAAKKAVQYIMACVDNKPGAQNGLAGAGKEYGSGYADSDTVGSYRWSDWSWVSDNCYSYIALMCMKKWAAASDDAAFSEMCNRYAYSMLTGINTHLKKSDTPGWYRVVGGNGETVSESAKIDALCYYPQKYDLPVPEYGAEDLGVWIVNNLQLTSGSDDDSTAPEAGFGAFRWGDVDSAHPEYADRLSQGFAQEAWLALVDTAGDAAYMARLRAKRWWEYYRNAGATQLWDTANGGIRDWYDPSDGSLAETWERFIDTSANCIFVYGGGYDHSMGTGSPDPTVVATVDVQGGTVTLDGADAATGDTSITIPAGAMTTAQAISITKLDANDAQAMQKGFGAAVSTAPIVAYHFSPSGLVFNQMITLRLGYTDSEHDGIVDGTDYRADMLKVLWWDGIEWRLVGGTVDQAANVVSCQVKHFSIYGLFPVAAMTDNDYRPKERIITPALADNINDYANFGGIDEGDIITIYDITGRRIVQLQGVNVWNGKNDSGAVVESGLYIYQIKKESGKIISGTIVVAK